MAKAEILIPILSIEDATAAARQYLNANGVDLSGRFLVSAVWTLAAEGEPYCWYLEWMSEVEFEQQQTHRRTRGGGYLTAQVFDESHVRHSFAR